MLRTSLGRGIAARSRKAEAERKRIEELKQSQRSAGPDSANKTQVCIPYAVLGKCRRSAKKCHFAHKAACICNRQLLEAASAALAQQGNVQSAAAVPELAKLARDAGFQALFAESSAITTRLVQLLDDASSEAPRSVQATPTSNAVVVVRVYTKLRDAEKVRERERRRRKRQNKRMKASGNAGDVPASGHHEPGATSSSTAPADSSPAPTAAKASSDEQRKDEVKSLHQLQEHKNDAGEAGVEPKSKPVRSVDIQRFRKKKRKLWSKWDQGIVMPDPESWFSCCPEAEAVAIARCCAALWRPESTDSDSSSTGKSESDPDRSQASAQQATSARGGNRAVKILDAFCGVGGNAIRFAKVRITVSTIKPRRHLPLWLRFCRSSTTVSSLRRIAIPTKSPRRSTTLACMSLRSLRVDSNSVFLCMTHAFRQLLQCVVMESTRT